MLLLIVSQAISSAALAENENADSHDAATQRSDKTVRIVLIGDSTVADGSGWGSSFGKRVGRGAECLNLARSGRSSKSYLDEGHWEKVLALKPDYVLIQFGHNDQPGKGPKRETDPDSTYRQFLTRYIEETRAIGARPILVTSMTRRQFSAEGKINSTLGPYVEAMKRLAREQSVPLVDLHARSIELLETMGPEAASALNPKAKQTGSADRTHLTPEGGELMAKLVVQELKKVEPSLAGRLD